MKNSEFGKSDLDHTFTSEASFEHIMMKGNFLTHQNKRELK